MPAAVQRAMGGRKACGGLCVHGRARQGGT
jgi:hypothetical protein